MGAIPVASTLRGKIMKLIEWTKEAWASIQRFSVKDGVSSVGHGLLTFSGYMVPTWVIGEPWLGLVAGTGVLIFYNRREDEDLARAKAIRSPYERKKKIADSWRDRLFPWFFALFALLLIIG